MSRLRYSATPSASLSHSPAMTFSAIGSRVRSVTRRASLTAPGAKSLRLIGDFNGWDRGANLMTRDELGVWSIFLPDNQFAQRLTHGSKVKVHVVSEAGGMDRIPAYIRRVVQEKDMSFTGQF